MRCRGADSRARRCTCARNRLSLKWYAPIASAAALVVQGRRAREKCSGAQRAPCRLAMVAAQIQRRKASRFVIARPRRGRGNLGKAAALVVQGRRARENVAALSERHAGWQWLRHKFSGAKPPDLSLRGPEGAVAISQNPVESWESSGEIVTAFPRLPRRCAPRNDTSGWCRGAPAPLRG